MNSLRDNSTTGSHIHSDICVTRAIYGHTPLACMHRKTSTPSSTMSFGFVILFIAMLICLVNCGDYVFFGDLFRSPGLSCRSVTLLAERNLMEGFLPSSMALATYHVDGRSPYTECCLSERCSPVRRYVKELGWQWTECSDQMSEITYMTS